MLIESRYEPSGNLTNELETDGLLNLSLRMDELLAKFDSLKAAAAAPIEKRAAKMSKAVVLDSENQLTQAGMMLIDW